MATVVITTDFLVHGDRVHRALTGSGHEVRYVRNPNGADDILAGADAAIVGGEPITAPMMAAAPTLRIVARSGVGHDAVDDATAADLGIWVTNTPGVNHHSVAEMTFALLLDVARSVSSVSAAVQSGQWPRQGGTELRGAVLGVIGFGPSGQAVTDIARAFGITVLVHTRHPRPPRGGVTFVDLDTLCASADYISLHSKADASNVHLINAERLAVMKPSAVLVNTARGSLVDHDALIDALDGGRLAAAALDVVDIEPLPPTSALRGRDNVIITSHLAGQTEQARSRAGIIAAENVIAALTGRRPPNPVNTPRMAGPTIASA
ncbi:phosphoglycerate dehydrogenase [Gordonia sp. (in: high G+C Gram-positive bacteria)]|uniref:phosphoglycerate dehydrogenase n=1 Tax=Gordonia sp. (in: high G+C Gram-positive bacteria) TaxID=84139 RepID=UPI0035ADAE6D